MILDTKIRPVRGTIEQRFEAKYTKNEDGCWIWNACLNNKGYGQFWNCEKVVLAHRHSYLIHKGPIPEGLELDHLCRTPACINPDHLEAVTHRENDIRGMGQSGVNYRKTHCIRGHAFDEENTVISQGVRQCRTCNRIRGARRENGWARQRRLAREKAELNNE